MSSTTHTNGICRPFVNFAPWPNTVYDVRGCYRCRTFTRLFLTYAHHGGPPLAPKKPPILALCSHAICRDCTLERYEQNWICWSCDSKICGYTIITACRKCGMRADGSCLITWCSSTSRHMVECDMEEEEETRRRVMECEGDGGAGGCESVCRCGGRED